MSSPWELFTSKGRRKMEFSGREREAVVVAGRGPAIWEARERTLHLCDAEKILDRAPAKFRDSDA